MKHLQLRQIIREEISKVLNENNNLKMSKPTAVEWLVKQMPTAFKNLTINKQIIEQALQMEKEQIIDAYNQGVTDEYGDVLDFTNDGDSEK